MSKHSAPVRAERLRRGLSLEDLAAKCAAEGVAVTKGALSRIERGQHAPQPALRKALADVLELDVLDFDQEAAS